MKINAAFRLSASLSVENSLDWITSYVERSWDLAPKFRKLSFVKEVLSPLVAVVPYVPIDKQLYRIVGSRKPIDGTPLPSDYLLSCTYGVGDSFWKDLASEIGADNGTYCSVLKINSPVHEVLNTNWLKTKVLPWARRWAVTDKQRQLVEDFDEHVSNYQKEVLVYSTSPIKVSVVKILEEDN